MFNFVARYLIEWSGKIYKGVLDHLWSLPLFFLVSNNIEVLDHLGSFIAIPSNLYVAVPVITDEDAHSSIIGEFSSRAFAKIYGQTRRQIRVLEETFDSILADGSLF